MTIPCAALKDDSFVAVTPRVKSTAFQLPPLPCTSSFQLHSFLNSVSASPVEKPTPHLLSFQNIAAKIQSKVHEGEFISPSSIPIQARPAFPSRFVHPNSPYVPWTHEARREILHPWATTSSDVNPDAICHSEIVNQASETTAPRTESETKRKGKLSANFRNLSSVISRNLKQVATKISKRKKLASTASTTEPVAISHAIVSNSFESADAMSLSMWLSDCRRMRMEAEKKAPSKEMTLDKYEEMGSWTQLPGIAPTNAHDHFPAPRNYKPHSHLTNWSGSLSVATSSPKIASSRFVEGLSREMSMPGGWTFS